VMKEVRTGILASVAFHACIIALFAGLSIGVQGIHKPVKTVVLDFTLLKTPEGLGRGLSGAAVEKVEGREVNKMAARPDTAKLKSPPNDQPQAAQSQRAAPPLETAQSSPVLTHRAAPISDPEGAVAVRGDATSLPGRGGDGKPGASAGTGTGTTEVFAAGGTGHGGNRTGGAGRGGEGLQGGKDYFYIRDRVLRNIKYPEKARRTGTEGQVLLSFVVLENGVTSDVKIVRSSGSRILDEDARETVARTIIDKKVPYRAAVNLPITYRLH
jgi:protein TonB